MRQSANDYGYVLSLLRPTTLAAIVADLEDVWDGEPSVLQVAAAEKARNALRAIVGDADTAAMLAAKERSGRTWAGGYLERVNLHDFMMEEAIGEGTVSDLLLALVLPHAPAEIQAGEVSMTVAGEGDDLLVTLERMKLDVGSVLLKVQDALDALRAAHADLDGAFSEIEMEEHGNIRAMLDNIGIEIDDVEGALPGEVA